MEDEGHVDRLLFFCTLFFADFMYFFLVRSLIKVLPKALSTAFSKVTLPGNTGTKGLRYPGAHPTPQLKT